MSLFFPDSCLILMSLTLSSAAHSRADETLYELSIGALSSSLVFSLVPRANEIQMLANATKEPRKLCEDIKAWYLED